MNGIAVRQALTLGLNLRNENPSLADSSKEIRYRVWWAIASIERTLSMMVGRATAFAGSDCSVPLPLPLEEETFMSAEPHRDATSVRIARSLLVEDEGLLDASTSTPSSVSSKTALRSPYDSPPSKSSLVFADDNAISPNNGMFFLYFTRLKNLDDDVLKQLYRPHMVNRSWATIQSMIHSFRKKLGRWRSALPLVFDFTRKQHDPLHMGRRMHLGFTYYSTMIIINRPCLCMTDESIPNETEKGRALDRESAAECIFAAKCMVNMLPDEPKPAEMYSVFPWWNIVHHLMQAVTALMLEMLVGAAHCPEQADELFFAAQKVVAWLQSMSVNDLAAARAWRLSSDVLRKVAPKVGRRIDDRLLRQNRASEDILMQDLLMPPTSFNPAASTYLPISFTGTDITSPQQQTTWEPLMFTNYDDHVVSADPTVTQPLSQQI
ncbi:MAG: hypothetical protein Q9219_003110 [cf. Caloplaca sp. 3 TL-2023]